MVIHKFPKPSSDSEDQPNGPTRGIKGTSKMETDIIIVDMDTRRASARIQHPDIMTKAKSARNQLRVQQRKQHGGSCDHYIY